MNVVNLASAANPMAAVPAIIMHNYVTHQTFADPKHGAEARTEGFWVGAWLRNNGTVFFCMEDGAKIEGTDAADVLRKANAYRKTLPNATGWLRKAA